MKDLTEAKKVLRSIRLAAVLQMTLLFLVWVILTRKIFAISSSLRDALYGSGVAAEEVDKVNRAFSSITDYLVWIFLVGIVLAGMSSGLLVGVIKKNWPKPSPLDHEE